MEHDPPWELDTKRLKVLPRSLLAVPAAPDGMLPESKLNAKWLVLNCASQSSIDHLQQSNTLCFLDRRVACSVQGVLWWFQVSARPAPQHHSTVASHVSPRMGKVMFPQHGQIIMIHSGPGRILQMIIQYMIYGKYMPILGLTWIEMVPICLTKGMHTRFFRDCVITQANYIFVQACSSWNWFLRKGAMSERKGIPISSNIDPWHVRGSIVWTHVPKCSKSVQTSLKRVFIISQQQLELKHWHAFTWYRKVWKMHDPQLPSQDPYL